MQVVFKALENVFSLPYVRLDKRGWQGLLRIFVTGVAKFVDDPTHLVEDGGIGPSSLLREMESHDVVFPVRVRGRESAPRLPKEKTRRG